MICEYKCIVGHVYVCVCVCVCVAHVAYSQKLASIVGVRDGSQHFKQILLEVELVIE